MSNKHEHHSREKHGHKHHHREKPKIDLEEQSKHAADPLRFPRESAQWQNPFHTYDDLKNAPPISFAIEGFLQNDGATMIGGLSGHGKTLIMLSIAKALLDGPGAKLWNYFNVKETAFRVIYLIPESALTPFKHRLKLFHLCRYVRNGRLLIYTLSKGPAPKLDDPRILSAAKGAHVLLDTAIRFGDGDENDAGNNKCGLASDVFGLLGAGAKTVIGAHHSPKSFVKENVMTLENVLRGTGDIGAMLCAAWGIKQLDARQNIIHIENIKSRDFQPGGPFQIMGRPHIDEDGAFRMHKTPGVCGSLMDEQQPQRNKGGASEKAQKKRAANKELLRQFLKDDSDARSQFIARRFKQAGISIKPGTIRRYRSEIRKEEPLRSVTPSA